MDGVHDVMELLVDLGSRPVQTHRVLRHLKARCGYAAGVNSLARREELLCVHKLLHGLGGAAHIADLCHAQRFVGKDTVGIIAKVCTYLADHNVNILDISQTIVGGYFNMMMVTDPSASSVETGQMSDDLTALGEGMGLSIRVMGEDIFNAMHRV